MITFLHSVVAALILAAALVWLGAASSDNFDDIEYETPLEPWYRRLWEFLRDWRENYFLYLILGGIILILYWVMQGILRIL